MHVKGKLHFDENVFIRQSMVRWMLLNARARTNAKSILIAGTIIFTFGILIGIDDSKFLNAFSIGGALALVYGLWWMVRLINGKRKYKEQLIDMSLDLKIKNYKTGFELTDSFFRYDDNQKEVKLNWEAFESYSLFDKDILFNQTQSFEFSFILGEDELGAGEYIAIKEFLSTKLKLREV